MKLLAYKEFINPENGGSCLKKRAIKIDGGIDGLKMRLDCQSIKSCDYFRLKKGGGEINFIEISDLKLQLKNLGDHIKGRELIRKEMINKFIGTIVIYLILERNINRSRNLDMQKNRTFSNFIIALFVENCSDVIAFQQLKLEVKSGLQSIVGKVLVVPFDALGSIL